MEGGGGTIYGIRDVGCWMLDAEAETSRQTDGRTDRPAVRFDTLDLYIEGTRAEEGERGLTNVVARPEEKRFEMMVIEVRVRFYVKKKEKGLIGHERWLG